MLDFLLRQVLLWTFLVVALPVFAQDRISYQRYTATTQRSTLTGLITRSGGRSGRDDPLQVALTKGDFDLAVRLAHSRPESPLSRLLQAAREAHLSKQPTWLVLLHYHKRALGGWRSEIDAPYFFMSDEGKDNPSRELEATLAAMFATQPRKPMRLTPGCRFVARRQWLKEVLGNASRDLPEPNCPEFDAYRKFFASDELTLIFPAAHPNSPSSAFGHTLLRLDHEHQDRAVHMLNQSLNFAAEVPEDVSPITYAFSGIAGGFKGKFRILPYHIKLREYGQVDNRDIWEYTLELDQYQIDRILAHAYEMLIAWYDYYFFRENCAYQLLSLLEVAFPEHRLSEEFPWWSIPVDTIKSLDEAGLIRHRRYEGSLGRKIRVRQRSLSSRQVEAARQIADSNPPIQFPKETFSQLEKAEILDLSSDYLRFKRLNQGGQVTRLSHREKTVLKNRSAIRTATQDISLPIPRFSPDQGHGTARVLGAMESREGVNQAVLQFRPAYHDFLDPSPGYGDNISIDFGSVSVGIQPGKAPFLKEFTLLDIQSVEPRDRFFKPISWRTRVAWTRPQHSRKTRFTLLGGGGLAWRANDNGPLFYVFADGSLSHDKSLARQIPLSLDLRPGILWEPVAGFRVITELISGRDLGNHLSIWKTRLATGFALGPNLSLSAEYSGQGEALDQLTGTVRMALRVYF